MVVCLRCLLHHKLSRIAYTFRENWDFVLIIIVQFMMGANNRIRYGRQIVFVCLYITPSHYRLSIRVNFLRHYSHYSDVIMDAMASQITSLTIVYSSVYSGAVQRKNKALRHWPLCGKFRRGRWIARTNGQERGSVHISSNILRVGRWSFCHAWDSLVITDTANTQHNKHVSITSKRRFDVTVTCLLRCVFVGDIQLHRVLYLCFS